MGSQRRGKRKTQPTKKRVPETARPYAGTAGEAPPGERPGRPARWRGSVLEAWRRLLRRLSMPAVIAVAVWLSRYRQSAGFGLYEDDYARIPLAMELSWPQIWKRLSYQLPDPFGGQGRLLHDEFIFMLARLGDDLGGLHAMHAIGCAILAANAILFYLLLKRLSRSPLVAVTGALAYALYPADTTQTFLTHSFGVQPSVTALLVALHLYVSRWRPLAYLVATFCLFQYETVFTPFLAAPLLAGPRRARSARRWAAHLAVAGGTLGAVFLMRKLAAEGRVAELDLATMVLVPFRQMTLGPLTAAAAFVAKPAAGLWAEFSEHKLLLGLAFAGFVMLFSRLRAPLHHSPDGHANGPAGAPDHARSPGASAGWPWLACCC